MAGKGSKRRKEDYHKFVSNYENIKWAPKLTDSQIEELMNEVRKVTKTKNKKHVN